MCVCSVVYLNVMSGAGNMAGREAVNILHVICCAEVDMSYSNGSESAPVLLISHF